MADIKQELDKIKARISDSNFLANKGLSNEVGIHVFKYTPRHELIVRDYIERLVAAPSDDFRIIERDMYKILLELLEEKRVLGAVPSLEEKKGKDYLLSQLQKIAPPEAFIAKMKYEPHERGDVLFLTGIGKVYPFMRSHKMLDSMQQTFSDMPIVIFYPGEWSGQSLILFEKFHDGNYYRAFNMHRYGQDTLVRLRTDYVHEQQERYRTQLNHIAAALNSATGAERAKLLKQQDKLTEQAREIGVYEEKVHHLADQNMMIDLDDGVKKNYEIFADVLAKIG
jgi:hypothetical protein